MKKNSIIAIIVIAASVTVTNGLQFFIVSKIDNKSRQKYESQILDLNTTLEEIGPLTDVWTVKKGISKDIAGTTIMDGDLEKIKFPESAVQENFIMDKYDAVDKYYKVDLTYGTPLTNDMIMDTELDDTSREQDIVADVFPVGLKVGDYVDIRLLYPKGEDYVVVSHLRVDEINSDTVKVVMTEQQRLFYDSAYVENYINSQSGSLTYFAKYTEPGIQKEATVTYSVPQSIMTLLNNNPDIVTDIQNGVINRDVIDSNTELITSDEAGSLQSGRTDYKSKIQAARQLYESTQQQVKEEEASNTEDASEESTFGATDANGLPLDLNSGGSSSTSTDSSDTGGVE